MIKKPAVIALLFILIILAPEIASAGTIGNVNFMLGQKSLNKADWEPLEDQPAFGVHGDFRRTNWPVSFAFSLVLSKDSTSYFNYYLMDTIEVEASTFEFNIGVKKVWDVHNFHPFLGGGISVVDCDISWDSDSFDTILADGDGIGFWVSTGGFWTLRRFNIGINVTYSSIDADLDYPDGSTLDVEAGGTTFGLLLGFHIGR